MTCVVGIETPDGVVMGADSFCGTDDGTQSCVVDDKVFRRGAWLFGLAGSARMGELVRYGLKLGDPPRSGVRRALSLQFLPAISELARDKYVEIADSQGQKFASMDLLVGVRGRLYIIRGDMTIGRNDTGFEAIGSGAQAALGALHAMPKGWSSRRRILCALSAAERWASGTRRPFRVVSGGPR